ncbi:hypothetical protein AAHE18_15G194500 [Arachis hypogaea]
MMTGRIVPVGVEDNACSPNHQPPLAVESLFGHIATSPSHVGHLVARLFGHLAVAHLYVLLLSVVVAVVDATSVGHLTRVPLLATSRFVYFVSVVGSPPKSPFRSPP